MRQEPLHGVTVAEIRPQGAEEWKKGEEADVEGQVSIALELLRKEE